MATSAKKSLSGSSQGKAIKVAATSSPGTLVHTGPTTRTSNAIGTVSDFSHEVWLYASNSDTTARKLTLEWGDSNGVLELTVPAEGGLALLIPGLVIDSAATALTVKAFCATADVISLYGYIVETTD